MTNALIVVALAIGAYLLRRVLGNSHATRGIDVGTVSSGWIADHRREDLR